MKFDIIIKNGTVINADSAVKCDIGIKDEKIAAILDRAEAYRHSPSQLYQNCPSILVRGDNFIGDIAQNTALFFGNYH